jgi:hypothetical protein
MARQYFENPQHRKASSFNDGLRDDTAVRLVREAIKPMENFNDGDAGHYLAERETVLGRQSGKDRFTPDPL